MFEIAIQTGAILAVVIVYWQKIRETLVALRQRAQGAALRRSTSLVGFLPAVVIGLLIGKAIKEHLFTPVVVATTFIVGALRHPVGRAPPAGRGAHQDVDDMTPLDALKVGLCQCLGMIPGTSRSGATIIGGMLLGLSRKVATEFSFFLAIPTLIGAGVLQPVQGARAAVGGRPAAVRGRPRVLVPGRLALRALAAALHLHPHLRAVRLVPDRLRHRRAGHGLERAGRLATSSAPRRRAGRGVQRFVNTRSQTPWPSLMPRFSNLVSGRQSGPRRVAVARCWRACGSAPSTSSICSA